MGRKKKVPTIDDFPEITEQMVKCAQGDQTAIRVIGDYVEFILRGKFGKLLEVYFRGKETEVLNRSKQDLANAQFFLGMIGAVKEIQLDLEQFVLDKDKLNEPIEKQDDSVE